MLSKKEVDTIKDKAAQWAVQFDVAMVLDSNYCEHAFGLGKYELLIAAGVKHQIVNADDAFNQLEKFKSENEQEWMFGFLTYDLKNKLEQLQSNHQDFIGFEDLYFFVPQKLLVINTQLQIIVGQDVISEILTSNEAPNSINNPIALQQKVSKLDYIQTVEKIKEHIVNGDVYELNYCVEFFAHDTTLNPVHVYNKLREKSAVPFGSFVKYHNRYVVGASPERFMTKVGNTLYSQPIKGTAKRGITKLQDEEYKHQLLNSEKERAENLMIVDLVRNDLARTAQTGTVKVEELFGIYSFPQVHQMISTVSSHLAFNANSIDAIKYAFPMGSMTGAPKIMAMKLIEKYEQTKRGLYSGAIGYFSADGNFDFNVVIRSIQYNAQTGYVNFEVGSAITYDSVALDEYEECMLKAKILKEILSGSA